jgi:hypothetical protein
VERGARGSTVAGSRWLDGHVENDGWGLDRMWVQVIKRRSGSKFVEVGPDDQKGNVGPSGEKWVHKVIGDVSPAEWASEREGCSRDKQEGGWMEDLVGWASEREGQQRCPEKAIWFR